MLAIPISQGIATISLRIGEYSASSAASSLYHIGIMKGLLPSCIERLCNPDSSRKGHSFEKKLGDSMTMQNFDSLRPSYIGRNNGLPGVSSNSSYHTRIPLERNFSARGNATASL